MQEKVTKRIQVNHVKVLFFATLRDRLGARSVDLDIPSGSTVGTLKSELTARYPVLKELIGHALIAVNREYVFDPSVIPADAEVALFPPVSGG
jgi:molybdopterin converting factor subunit 1